MIIRVKATATRLLAALGAEAGITRSHFAREIVVTALLGHAYLPARSRSSC